MKRPSAPKSTQVGVLCYPRFRICCNTYQFCVPLVVWNRYGIIRQATLVPKQMVKGIIRNGSVFIRIIELVVGDGRRKTLRSVEDHGRENNISIHMEGFSQIQLCTGWFQEWEDTGWTSSNKDRRRYPWRYICTSTACFVVSIWFKNLVKAPFGPFLSGRKGPNELKRCESGWKWSLNLVLGVTPG